jgi:hypothetical protein
MLFSYDKLIDNCISVNRISTKKLRSIFSLVNKTFKRYSVYTLEQIKEEDEHFHYIIRKYKEKIIKDILRPQWSKKMLNSRVNKYTELCQISIIDSEESRIVGILEKINNSTKHPERNYLFSPLFYDFEHSFHPNLRKKRLKNNGLICIMKEKDCLEH